MDETEPDEVVVTVGQRLREAREAKGLSVEDIAAQTRIPTRHLTSLEESDWDKLPAATYSVGFAKNYAGAVGLDRNEIGELLRAEMGGTRLAAAATPEVYEAIDPARTMPKGLVIGALALLVVVVLALSWFSNRSMQPDQTAAGPANVAAPVENVVAAPPTAAPAATGPVVLTATEAVWIQVKDGTTTLQQGELAAGQSYQVPASAVAPVVTTGKPEALRVMVGTTAAPALGEPGKTVSRVSLKAVDLLRAPDAQPAPATVNSPVAPPRPSPTVVAPAAPDTTQANGAAPATAN
jgi:cytoskeletal protein RodZ